MYEQLRKDFTNFLVTEERSIRNTIEGLFIFFISFTLITLFHEDFIDEDQCGDDDYDCLVI